ncbi:MAG: PAS domain S-box protein [Thiobacillaceae bacterium]
MDTEDTCPASAPQTCQPPLILLVEDDPTLVHALAERMQRDGHAVRVHPAIPGGPATAVDGPAALEIYDVTGPGAPALPLSLTADGLLAPRIYISARDDINARLAAQRAGATRYLTQPVDLDRLMLQIDTYLLRTPERPYRVLLVADDVAALAAYAEAIEARGMQVETLTDPYAAHAAAVRLRPECLVLQRDMAACSGDELAGVLRADARFQELPIVFLMRADDTRPLPLLDGVGETCLPERVAPNALAATIALRVRRARSQRRLNEDLRAALRESRVLRLALDVHNLVCITDTSGVIAYVNDAFCRASGYKRRELLGQGFGLLKSGVHSAGFYAEVWQALRQGEVWRGEFCNRRKDGSLYWVDTSIVPYQDEAGRPTRYLGVGTDVTRLKALEQALAASRPDARPD